MFKRIRFVTPTQNFFMTLYFVWNNIKQSEVENDNEAVKLKKK